MSVLVFGEVLWDIYPSRSVIGGASFNFAAHLSRLGTPSCLISAVGADALGETTRERLREMDVSDEFTSEVSQPTGICQVAIDERGVPSYTLLRQVAYDYISLSEEQHASLSSPEYDAFYFGTLAQRGDTSRATLRRILSDNYYRIVFFDINIRQSFYSRDVIEHGLRACNILKLSREEAHVFEELELVGVRRDGFTEERPYLEALCVELYGVYCIPTVLLTLDKDGAMVYTGGDGAFIVSRKPEGRVVSTVGAGDSFSACWLHFALTGSPARECLSKAVTLSDYVVGHLESIPDYSRELVDKLGL